MSHTVGQALGCIHQLCSLLTECCSLAINYIAGASVFPYLKTELHATLERVTKLLSLLRTKRQIYRTFTNKMRTHRLPPQLVILTLRRQF